MPGPANLLGRWGEELWSEHLGPPMVSEQPVTSWCPKNMKSSLGRKQPHAEEAPQPTARRAEPPGAAQTLSTAGAQQRRGIWRAGRRLGPQIPWCLPTCPAVGSSPSWDKLGSSFLGGVMTFDLEDRRARWWLQYHQRGYCPFFLTGGLLSRDWWIPDTGPSAAPAGWSRPLNTTRTRISNQLLQHKTSRPTL